MPRRKPISAGELYANLDREFRSRQSRDCASCYLLLPYRVDRVDHDAPNWEVIIPAPCPHDCSRIIEELVDEYALRYDICDARE